MQSARPSRRAAIGQSATSCIVKSDSVHPSCARAAPAPAPSANPRNSARGSKCTQTIATMYALPSAPANPDDPLAEERCNVECSDYVQRGVYRSSELLGAASPLLGPPRRPAVTRVSLLAPCQRHARLYKRTDLPSPL